MITHFFKAVQIEQRNNIYAFVKGGCKESDVRFSQNFYIAWVFIIVTVFE